MVTIDAELKRRDPLDALVAYRLETDASSPSGLADPVADFAGRVALAALRPRTPMTPSDTSAVLTNAVLITVGVTQRLRLFLVTVHEHPDATGKPVVTLKHGSTPFRTEFLEPSLYLPFVGPFEFALGESLTITTTTADRIVVNASYELY